MNRTLKGGSATGANAPRRRQSFGFGRAAWFDAEIEPAGEDALTVGGTAEVVDRDANLIRTTGATLGQVYRVRITTSPRPNYVAPTITLEPGPNLVQDPTDAGTIRTLSSGPSRSVTLTNYSREQVLSVTPSVRSTSTTLDEFVSWRSGTLAAHCTSAVDSRLAGKNASVALRVFTTQNHAAGVYVRNPQLWCADLVQDLTCASPWNSQTANRIAATWITPRHCLQAAHAGLNDGTDVVAVAADGTRHVRRQLRARSYAEVAPGLAPDLRVAVMDSDVPETIRPALLAPASLYEYLPNLRPLGIGVDATNSPRVPSVGLDQEEKALVSDLLALTQQNLVPPGMTIALAGHARPNDAQRLEFYEDKISGDSGNPSFLVINNRLVLTTVWTLGGGGTGAFVGSYIAGINALIAACDAAAGISTGYTVTTADLSGFPSY